MRVLVRSVTALVALTAFSVLGTGCPDEVIGVAGIGQVCSADIDCAVGLKCLNNVCAVEPTNGAPIADPGANRVTIQGFEVTLDASNSSDPEGESLTYAWTLISGPASSGVTLTAADQATLVFTPDAPGVYELTLTVNDGLQDSLPAGVAVFVFDEEGKFPTVPEGAECVEGFQCATGICLDGSCAPNNVPTANAGVSREVALGTEVQLDGSNSSDPDGDTLTFNWQLTQTPAGSLAVIADGQSAATSFIADVEGLYVATLFVNDGYLTSAAATVGIYAGEQLGLRDDGEPCEKDLDCASGFCFEDACKTNEAPIADPGAAQLAAVGQALTLDGGQSSDPEGLTLTYAWDINAAPNGSAAVLTDANTATPTLTPDVEGLYLVRLVVNDGQVNSLPAVVAVVAEPPSGLPIGEPCNAGTDCQSGKCNTACESNAAPVAVAGTPQSVVTGDVVTLDGTGSTDADSDPITYLWVLEAPPTSTATLDDPTAAMPTFTADLDGIYQVSLVVNDGFLDSLESVTAVVASTPSSGLPNGDPCIADNECASSYCAASGCATNQIPVAVVNELTYTEPGTPVVLDSTGTTDADGQPLTYQWTLTDVPAGSVANFADATVASPGFTPDVAGVYFFQLVVNDGYDDSQPAIGAVIAQAGSPIGAPCTNDAQCISGLCDLAGASVCAENQPPIADPGSPQVVEVGQVVNLDGSASTDPEGRPLTFQWAISSAPGGSTASLTDADTPTPSFTADAEGLFLLQLTLSDGYTVSEAGVAVVAIPPGLKADGESCADNFECISGDCTGSVCVTNTAPVAAVSGPSSVILGVPFNVDGSASSDADSDPLTYAWSLISAPAGSTAMLMNDDQAVANVTPDVAGTYSFILIVDDGKVSSDPAGLNVIVPPNDAPNASLTITTAPPFGVGTQVDLDASGSSDPNNQPLNYTWDFLTRPANSTVSITGTGATANFVPDVAGTYVARVTVDDGALSDFDLAIAVVEGINAPPVADAGDNTILANGSNLFLFGHNSFDPDGTALSFSWALTSEPAGSSLVLTDADTAVATGLPTVDGDYVFELTVDDGSDTATDTVTITVASGNVPTTPYWDWIGGLVQPTTLYYVTNETYESWTFTPGFDSNGVAGVLIDRELLGPWADTQEVFDPIVQWDANDGLLIVGYTGDVPGVGTVTTAAEPPLVWFPANLFTTGTQVSYSLVQTVDGSGQTISEVIRREVSLDADLGENPIVGFNNGIAGGPSTEMLQLTTKTKRGQAPEMLAIEGLVPGQGLFLERASSTVADFDGLSATDAVPDVRLLSYNTATPVDGGVAVEPATAPVALYDSNQRCLADAVPCTDNLGVAAFSADCANGTQYCVGEGACHTSSSGCPFGNLQSHQQNAWNADWDGIDPVWVDPFDQEPIAGIADGMEVTEIYLSSGVNDYTNPWIEDYKLYGFIRTDGPPDPGMKYTLAFRQNPPANTVGDIFLEFTYNDFQCCGGPWVVDAVQTVSQGVGPNLSCSSEVRVWDSGEEKCDTEGFCGISFEVPIFGYGGNDPNGGDRLPSMYELLYGYDPESYGSVQDDALRATMQFEACGLYADGCSDEILAPVQMGDNQLQWQDSFFCSGGGS